MSDVSGRPLIIVESPTKARTISKFMKSRYDVKASLGHVRDLPKSQLGVDISNGFTPKYITIRGKGDVIKELKEAAKRASAVYLATDPDREGEAISWHLCAILGINPDEAKRVTFHEITEKAVKEAFRHPVPIDKNLVLAQQARRVLDRLVGYSLSPLLWHKVRPGLSAGRVQSAALRIIVDREKEIENFVPQEYWTLDVVLKSSKGTVKARYFGENGEKKELREKSGVDSIIKDISGRPFTVISVTPKERHKSPPFPFTTSTLQQEASRKLGFPVRKTMMIAQLLYEGVELGPEGYVGLITYMRTDSTRVSPLALNEAREYVTSAFGPSYVGFERKEKERPGVQGAHEAIRPTSVSRTPDKVKPFLKPDQYKLYKLIWDRFVASQMAPAVYDTVTCDIQCGSHTFRATGSRLKFPGFAKVYEEGQDAPLEEGEKEEGEIIPLSQGEVLSLEKVVPAQHFTEPPPRYTEASLVKELEENGIGRPSTYAPIIATLIEREYVQRDKKRLVPTELGRLVDMLLRENFPSIVDVKFTAEMEKRLDSVEEGKEPWDNVVREFWEPFKEQVEKAEREIKRVEVEDEPAGINCEKCGRPMVIKRSRYGKFIACSGYPECKNTKPLVEKAGVKCPKCQGEIVVRRSKTGRVFWGCENYPQCDFVTWNRPVPGTACPECGTFLVEAGGREKGYKCANPQCGYTHKI
ncbi:MAG: type I DNA topoisomerase [Candidatus Fermentithermobacillus carboniphilus]|uniref:DNA topoisomerase 1 n=1 Tax=Candidatus Fermentithermobacillus carboniphilus TaxID=3085328 RepID=A0AAT9LCS1_9FIRM|nr:MAG: type I DNA topoisomerase [Candidatus Fermentithermobacillus carboniphilus]